MYAPGTILVKKTQKKPEKVKGPDKEIINEETGEKTYESTTIEIPFPYNKVRVVGASFITRPSGEAGEWEGSAAAGVILEPAGESFGRTLDEPLGKIQSLYNVESVPEIVIEAPQIRVRDAYTAASGPTPEDVFKEKAPGSKPKAGQTRARTPHTSPLEDVRKPTISSPLD